jgi:hypothetical protein
MRTLSVCLYYVVVVTLYGLSSIIIFTYKYGVMFRIRGILHFEKMYFEKKEVHNLTFETF